ncbi:MAG: PKD domain-containing protein [Deltaproteobacteria bacterium]|nr:PKD domain-containing protein [Deltaproteobacteria bacterium]
MKFLVIPFFLLAFLALGCDDDKEEPVTADFTVTVVGEAPDATLQIENLSINASDYSWSFGEGASTAVSTDETPTGITVDKAGELSITLTCTNGSKTQEVTKTVTVEGYSAILEYTDIEFSSKEEPPADAPRYFSFDTGESYSDDDVDSIDTSILHLMLSSLGTIWFFESPSYYFDDAGMTKFVNYSDPVVITTTQFDEMTDDRLISDLEINNTDESFPGSIIPHVILFEISSGRKGVIKTTAVNAERLLVDIKIQKY